ncbi:MAG: SDR family NAD(P)-dependent oxidoreductase [Dehalococcoidia bacterium]|jgi:NAD(P)-dependent dehydrogenase (short-subunit alcohol dehydrogenase family)|nr:SDR family NAD(P)-dependent oxidoreductase [Dehalococcoidia bacterium]
MTNPDNGQETKHSNRLENSVVAITGAGSGNGRASALRTGREGASLYISDINPELLEDTLGDLKAEGIEAAGGIFDAANIADAPRFIDAVKDAYGRVDVLVNNAGAVRIEPFPNVSEENWDWTMDLNLKGAFFVMQEAAKPMMEQRSGNIVNIASIAGTFGGPTSSPPYAAAKAGLVNLTTVAAASLAGYGVRVNAIAPGIINTPFHAPVDLAIGQEQLGLKPGEHIHTRVGLIPLGRLGEPEDVAATVAFLASEDAGHISGETITVAGAMRSL